MPCNGTTATVQQQLGKLQHEDYAYCCQPTCSQSRQMTCEVHGRCKQHKDTYNFTAHLQTDSGNNLNQPVTPQPHCMHSSAWAPGPHTYLSKYQLGLFYCFLLLLLLLLLCLLYMCQAVPQQPSVVDPGTLISRVCGKRLEHTQTETAAEQHQLCL